ncbi:unnamed protein product, partial [Timema podura]|nr:unnamed protein product [Timema podura]
MGEYSPSALLDSEFLNLFDQQVVIRQVFWIDLVTSWYRVVLTKVEHENITSWYRVVLTKVESENITSWYRVVLTKIHPSSQDKLDRLAALYGFEVGDPLLLLPEEAQHARQTPGDSSSPAL